MVTWNDKKGHLASEARGWGGGGKRNCPNMGKGRAELGGT